MQLVTALLLPGAFIHFTFIQRVREGKGYRGHFVLVICNHSGGREGESSQGQVRAGLFCRPPESIRLSRACCRTEPEKTAARVGVAN